MRLAFVVLALALFARPALPCGNATRAEQNQAVKRLKRAEAELSAEHYETARKLTEMRLGDAYDRPLTHKWYRLRALVLSRDPSSKQPERDEAARMLGGWVDAEASPTERAELAEVLTRIEGGQEPALQILRELAAKDLLGNAYALAALAKLERAAGRSREADAAKQRCTTAAVIAAICDR